MNSLPCPTKLLIGSRSDMLASPEGDLTLSFRILDTETDALVDMEPLSLGLRQVRELHQVLGKAIEVMQQRVPGASNQSVQ